MAPRKFKMTNVKLEPCYYGDRKVIYVQMRHPDTKNGQRTVSVYGSTLDEVVSAVDRALSRAFGKTGANRPTGRPKRGRVLRK